MAQIWFKKDYWVEGCECGMGFVLVSSPSNETLPHVNGHGGEEFSKGETELVQNIAHLLDHAESHVCTQPQILHLSFFYSQSYHVTNKQNKNYILSL